MKIGNLSEALMPLGRGLDSLIPGPGSGPPPKPIRDRLPETGERILELAPDKIQPNPMQPRESFSEEDLKELVDSIKEYGIIQPLVVSAAQDGGYELVAGERRLRAAKILKLKSVPAIVRSAKDQEKLELTLVENIQRKDLGPIEKARAYQRLISEFNLTQEKVAKRVGKSRPQIANTLRLLGLPKEAQIALEQGKISEGHAKAILALETAEAQLKALKRALEGYWSVRETEKAVRSLKRRKGLVKPKDPVLQAKEEELRDALGTKVTIEKRGKKGKIIIEFYSPEELDEIISRIKSE